MALAGRFEAARMKEMDAYIGVRGATNSSQFSDVPLDADGPVSAALVAPGA